MLERLWRKGNPPTLLVGMKIGTITMENNMEVLLKKLKIELPYDPAIVYPSPGNTSRGKHGLKGYMHPSDHCSTIYNNQDMEAT